MNEGYSKFDIYVFDIRFSFVFIFLTKTITSFWNIPLNTCCHLFPVLCNVNN